MRILESSEHPATSVDPFGWRPCDHATVTVHITDGAGIGDDLIECLACRWSSRLADLYAPMAMPKLD